MPYPASEANRFVTASRRLLVLLTALVGLSCGDDSGTSPSSYHPRTRTYYVQAEDVAWDYMPFGYDSVFDRPLPAPWGDSLVYPKIRYVGYTDATFATPVPQPEWLGVLGPIIRGVVGDTLRVVFRNAATIPLSMHPHGVSYAPEDEGALYQPPRGGGDSVTAGGEYTYTWYVEKQAGPAPGEPSSRVWLYHSHALAPEMEQYRGLIGTIIVTDPKHANDDATPNDVAREFVTLWLVFNENDDASDPALEETNLRHSINGLMFGNLTGFTMNSGEKVRWYLVALGTEVDLHTPHWHGEKVTLEGRTYTDVVELLPAAMKVGDMVADNPGTWLLHCHVADHMMAGMFTRYTINPPPGTPVGPARLVDDGPGWYGFGSAPRDGGHHH